MARLSSIIFMSAMTLLNLSSYSIETILTSKPKNTDLLTTNNSSKAASQAIDEILKDTLSLLDNLDKRVSTVKNKTSNALMRDNLRLLDDSIQARADKRINSTDAIIQEVTSNDSLDSEFAKLDEAVIEEALVGELSKKKSLDSTSIDSMFDDTDKAKGLKRARQMSDGIIGSSNHNQNIHSLASDSTERHIKFTLELMQSIFANQGYSAKNQNSIESFLISPFSIQMVLMLMHLGSRGNTRREINNCLHLNSPDLEGPILPAVLATSPNDDGHDGSSLFDAQPSNTNQQSSQSSQPKLKRRQGLTSAGPITKVTQMLVPKSQANIHANIPTSVVNSDTAHELFGAAIKNLLKDQTVGKALTIANKLFIQKNLPVSSQYDWAIKHYYASDVKQVDFQYQHDENVQHEPLVNSTPILNSTIISVKNNNASGLPIIEKQIKIESVQSIINDWVERQTKGRITNFLTSPIPTSTLLMALNVIFFKGDWQYKFDPSDTETDAWFTLANGKTTKIPMMVNRLPLAYTHSPQLKTSAIELPYRAQRLGLFLLLPDDVSGIFRLMQMLNSTSFANLIASMKKPSPGADMTNGAVNLRLPKFTIESTPRLSQILSQNLGLKSLFSPDLADLSGFFDEKKNTNLNTSSPIKVGVDELIHKAILQVDEQGSVAAASSATIVERVGLFNGNYFEADHPFMLFLMDKQTGLVLFSGVYAGPSSSSDGQITDNKE